MAQLSNKYFVIIYMLTILLQISSQQPTYCNNKSNSYIDENGQEWSCVECDLMSGQFVQENNFYSQQNSNISDIQTVTSTPQYQCESCLNQTQQKCSICLNQNKCLKCADSQEYLDVDSLQCVKQCSENQIQYMIGSESSQQLRLCRSNHYFIDASSQIDLELGTIEYPYKKITTAVKEIHNSLIGLNRSIYINIKNSTFNHVWIVQDPIELSYLNLGLISNSETQINGNLFELKYSNVNMYNLDIYTEEMLYHVVILQKNNINTLNMNSTVGYTVVLNNSIIDLSRSRGLQSNIVTCDSSKPIINSFIVQNSYFYGNSFDEYSWIASQATYGNIQFINNTFDLVSPSSWMIFQFTSAECAKIQPNMFIFENNTVTTLNTSSASGGSGTSHSFKISLSVNVEDPDGQIAFKASISNNNFKNFVIRNPIFEVSSNLQQTDIIISKNKLDGLFLDEGLQIKDPLFYIVAPFSQTKFSKNLIKNLNIDSIFRIQSGQSAELLDNSITRTFQSKIKFIRTNFNREQYAVVTY
eukprot:403345261